MEPRRPLISMLVASTSKAKVGVLPFGNASTGVPFNVYDFRAVNNTGAANTVGLCRLMYNFKFYTISSSGTMYQDFTSQIQAGTATCGFDTLGSDGFLIGANRPIGVLGMTVSAGGNSTSGVTISTQYYNGNWTATNVNIDAFPTTLANNTDNYFSHLPAQDWSKGTGTSAGVNNTYYYLKVTATNGQPAPLTFNNVWVGEWLHYQPGIGNNAQVELKLDTFKPLLLEAGESVMGYFAATSGTNTVAVQYGLNG